MIKIVDSIMGSGKTSYVIQMINDNPDMKVVYITPYLDEVSRIKTNCPGFEEPQGNPMTGEVKLDSLNKLLSDGKNVASTHQLFKHANADTIKELKKWKYTLIIDEVLEVVNTEDFKKDDLPTIIKAGHAHVEDTTGYLIWDNPRYDGQYNHIKRLCQSNSVFVVNDVALVWVFPATIFQYFEDIYVCTYMFDAQILRYYFDLHKKGYETYRVIENNGKYQLIKRLQCFVDDTSNIKINIHLGKKNDIGTFTDKGKYGITKLSSSWYSRAEKDKLKRIKDNMCEKQ